MKKFCALFLIIGCVQAYADDGYAPAPRDGYAQAPGDRDAPPPRDDHYLPPPQDQTCSRDEIENAVRHARQETLDIVRQDMQVESRVTINSYGANERECYENGSKRLRENGAGDDAIRDCNDKRKLFKDVNCAIVDVHPIGGITSIMPSPGDAQTNNWYPEDQDKCIQNSMAQAEQNAMKACQSGGLACEITQHATTPNLADNTMYLKDGWRGIHKHQSVYCKSHAVAAPVHGSAQVQCSIEGVARMKF